MIRVVQTHSISHNIRIYIAFHSPAYDLTFAYVSLISQDFLRSFLLVQQEEINLIHFWNGHYNVKIMCSNFFHYFLQTRLCVCGLLNCRNINMKKFDSLIVGVDVFIVFFREMTLPSCGSKSNTWFDICTFYSVKCDCYYLNKISNQHIKLFKSNKINTCKTLRTVVLNLSLKNSE